MALRAAVLRLAVSLLGRRGVLHRPALVTPERSASLAAASVQVRVPRTCHPRLKSFAIGGTKPFCPRCRPTIPSSGPAFGWPLMSNVSRMNLHTLGCLVISQLDRGTYIEQRFSFPQGEEVRVLQSILEGLLVRDEVSVVDPSNADCALEAKRYEAGFEIKRDCHGSFGTWRAATESEADAWLLPGRENSRRSGYEAIHVHPK
jgi:hypothetical protein